MKKLITLILILALALPAIALADDPFRITKHYSLHIDTYAGDAMTAKGGKVFDFDSETYDLYLASDGTTGYLISTTCTAGLFINSGMAKVSVVDLNGQMFLLDDAGNHRNIMYDEDGDLWIDMGFHYFRMQLVDHVSIYEDMK